MNLVKENSDRSSQASTILNSSLERFTRNFKIHDVSECKDITEIGSVIDAGTYSMTPSKECGGFSVVHDHLGNALTMVNSTFKLSQPMQTLAELDSLKETIGFEYSEAGFLNNGKRLFIKGKLGKFDVNGDGSDVIEKHIIALDGFDGSTSRQIMLGFVRMACANGQLMYDVASYIMKVKHTKNAQNRVNDALTQATGITQRFQFLEDDLALLAGTTFSEKQVSRVAEIVFPNDTKTSENTRERILEQFSNERLGTNGSSAWDCFNAFTAWNNHDRSSRKTAQTSRMENQFLATEVNSRQFGSDVRKGIDVVLEETKKEQEKLLAEAN